MGVVVAGGGIGGLSAAYHLLKAVPRRPVIVVEAADRAGGWIRSHSVGGCRFESGPRSVRGVGQRGWLTLSMVEDIGLSDRLVAASQAAAKNRFLYTSQSDGRKAVVAIPRSGAQMVSHDMTRKHVAGAMLRQVWGAGEAASSDESLQEFFSRQLGPDLTDKLVGAMSVGIFAGSYRKLSVRSCFPAVASMQDGHRSLLHGAIAQSLLKKKDVPAAEVIAKPLNLPLVERTGVFSFRGGLEELPIGLDRYLRATYPDTYRLCSGAGVQDISVTPSGLEVGVTDGARIDASHVIAAVPSHALASMVRSHSPDAALAAESIPYSNVAVVNMRFPGMKHRLAAGFGHLVPPKEEEPLLGVIYDSFTFEDGDDSSTDLLLTAMLGGDLDINSVTPDVASMTKEAVGELAVSRTIRQLQLDGEPDLVQVSVHRNAIPQYTVGHQGRVLALEEALRGDYGDKLIIAGNSYGGVGINDSIWSGRQAAARTAA